MVFSVACGVPKGYLLRPEPPPLQGNPTIEKQAIFVEEGIASFYDEGFNGRRTASGEVFDTTALTAAHQSLPLGTWIQVVNLANGKTILVRVNDRGPFAKGRILDLSREAAEQLGFAEAGVTPIRLSVVRPAAPANYTIQVGSFLDMDRAQSLAHMLAVEHPSVHVTSESLGGVVYHRVRIDGFASFEEAWRLAANLDRSGLGTILLRDRTASIGADESEPGT